MKLNILFCGLGSIGKRHASLIQEKYAHHLFALRTYKGQEDNPLGLKELKSWEEVDRHRFDAAFITNPTYLHLEYAIQCAERGMHLFLEKPIDSKTDRLEELLSLVKKKKLSTYVAYQLRFHPVLNELRKWLSGRNVLHSRAICASYMPHWRSKQDYKKNYTAYREQGGGVVLDLSHELDYVNYLFSGVSNIQGLYGRRTDLTVDSDDFADLIVSHAKGITNVHLNFFSHITQRYIEVDTDNAYAKADLFHSFFEVTENGKESKKNFKLDRDDPYRAQLQYFFDHLNDPQMMNNLFEASPLFRKIIEFKETHEPSAYSLR